MITQETCVCRQRAPPAERDCVFWVVFLEKNWSLRSVVLSAKIIPFIPFAGTTCSLSGSRCWQSARPLQGCTRRTLSCGTAWLSTPSSESYRHCKTSTSSWKDHSLKEWMFSMALLRTSLFLSQASKPRLETCQDLNAMVVHHCKAKMPAEAGVGCPVCARWGLSSKAAES